eukprot:6464417-Amphidinium_carterae.1
MRVLHDHRWIFNTSPQICYSTVGVECLCLPSVVGSAMLLNWVRSKSPRRRDRGRNRDDLRSLSQQT